MYTVCSGSISASGRGVTLVLTDRVTSQVDQ
jgi:hypothetical protein